jgi:acylphosphatase
LIPVLRRVHLRVTGQVQGVFFRDSLRRLADSEGVAGWARNCSDGSVETVLEGDAASVERLVDFCRIGPGAARVDAVEVEEEPPEGLTEFQIRS